MSAVVTATIGANAEKQALQYLQKQGLQLITTNFSAKTGEIDLIMQTKDTLIFVEVRYRKNSNFGGAAASITRQKQHRIIRTANLYLQKYPTSLSCRFDVIAITANQLEWIPNAFSIS